MKYPNVPDQANVTPFVHALNYGYFGVMDILEAKGAMNYKNWIIASCIKDHADALSDDMISCGIAFEAKLDVIGRSILHYAVLHQSMKFIRQCLMNKHVNVNVSDCMNWCPLHYAAAKNYVQIIAILVEFGANICAKTNEGYLPINVAQKFGHCEAEYLLNRIQTERREEFGNSYHLSLTGSGHSDIVLSSLSNGRMDSDDDSCSSMDSQEWNKENEAVNGAKRSSVSQSNTQCSVSASQTVSNSENVNYAKYGHRSYKEPNVSVIVEDGFKEKVLQSESEFYGDFDEYDYANSEETSVDSQSNETRVIHPSFSDADVLPRKRRDSNEWIDKIIQTPL